MGKINIITTIIVTIMEFFLSFYQFFLGKIIWGIVFAIMGIVYIFWVVPMAFQNYKKEKEIKERMKKVQEKIDKEWRKF